MPSYSIDVNGQTYSFDSDSELNEQQATDLVRSQLAADVTPTETPPLPVVNGLPTGSDWLSATQRRVWEAAGAAKDIPKSAAGVVT
jgi:hypothetical protein